MAEEFGKELSSEEKQFVNTIIAAIEECTRRECKVKRFE